MSKKSITAIVAGILAVLVLATAAVWLFPVFKVSSFEIQGNSHVDAAQVEESSGVAVGRIWFALMLVRRRREWHTCRG